MTRRGNGVSGKNELGCVGACGYRRRASDISELWASERPERREAVQQGNKQAISGSGDQSNGNNDGSDSGSSYAERWAKIISSLLKSMFRHKHKEARKVDFNETQEVHEQFDKTHLNLENLIDDIANRKHG